MKLIALIYVTALILPLNTQANTVHLGDWLQIETRNLTGNSDNKYIVELAIIDIQSRSCLVETKIFKDQQLILLDRNWESCDPLLYGYTVYEKCSEHAGTYETLGLQNGPIETCRVETVVDGNKQIHWYARIPFTAAKSEYYNQNGELQTLSVLTKYRLKP